jgi:hypothetical protein
VRPFERTRLRLEDNIKTNFKGLGCEGVNWIRLVQERDRWRVLFNTAVK